MNKQLNEKEAYLAMIYYLENLYKLTKSEDLAGFLGSMALLEDEKPIDSAIWGDWEESIDKVLQQSRRKST